MGHLNTAGWTSTTWPPPLPLPSPGINKQYISDMGLWQSRVRLAELGLAGEVQGPGHTCLLYSLPLPTGYTFVILTGSHGLVQTEDARLRPRLGIDVVHGHGNTPDLGPGGDGVRKTLNG